MSRQSTLSTDAWSEVEPWHPPPQHASRRPSAQQQAEAEMLADGLIDRAEDEELPVVAYRLGRFVPALSRPPQPPPPDADAAAARPGAPPAQEIPRADAASGQSDPPPGHPAPAAAVAAAAAKGSAAAAKGTVARRSPRLGWAVSAQGWPRGAPEQVEPGYG